MEEKNTTNKLILSTMFIANPTASFTKTGFVINNSNVRVMQDLENIILRSTDLGEFDDTSKDKLIAFLEVNYKLDTEEIEIKDLNYGSAKISAKEGSRKYAGNTSVVFKTNLTPLIVDSDGIKTKNITVHAYNSKQTDSDVVNIKYKPDLGKEKFTNYFKNISFDWKSKTKNNGRKGSGGVRWHNSDNLNGLSQEVEYTKKNFTLNSNKLERTELYNRIYTGTNYTKVYGYFEYNWNKEQELDLKFTVTAESYATWINAYWADAENQLFVRNLKITA